MTHEKILLVLILLYWSHWKWKVKLHYGIQFHAMCTACLPIVICIASIFKYMLSYICS